MTLTPPKYQAEHIATELQARLEAAWQDGFRAGLNENEEEK